MIKEKLTETIGRYNQCNNKDCHLSYCDRECNHYNSMIDKLAEYEDLEEQGLLLRLPVAVGSKVYLINSRYTKCTKFEEEFDEYSCQGCECECDSHKEYYIYENKSVSAEWIAHNIENFGKTTFLTQSEAEGMLRELEGK